MSAYDEQAAEITDRAVELILADQQGQARDTLSPEVSLNQTPSDLQEHTRRDSRDSRDTNARSRRTSWTAAELLTTDFPEPRWAVPGVIAEGLTLFAGAPKVGKSWLSLGLGVSTATGGKALGRIDVDPGPALYLALEDTPRRLKSRLEKITAGDHPAGLDRLTVATECPPLPAGGDQRIADWLDNHRDARLVMIDVLSKIRGMPAPDTPQYDRDYAAVTRAKRLADDYGVAIVVVHHTRKMESDDWMDEVSGTRGISGAADAILALKKIRGAADGILHVVGRDVEEAQYALSFSPELGTWSLLDTPPSEIAMGDTRRAILQHVRDHEPARPKDIAETLDLDYELTKKTCARMVKDGQIDSDGKGNYFTPYSAVPTVPAVPVAGQSTDFQGHPQGQVSLGVPDEPKQQEVPLFDRLTNQADQERSWQRVEPGRGKPGVGRAITTVTYRPDGWYESGGIHTARQSVCSSILERRRARLDPCANTVTFKVETKRNHNIYTHHVCGEHLAASTKDSDRIVVSMVPPELLRNETSAGQAGGEKERS